MATKEGVAESEDVQRETRVMSAYSNALSYGASQISIEFSLDKIRSFSALGQRAANLTRCVQGGRGQQFTVD